MEIVPPLTNCACAMRSHTIVGNESTASCFCVSSAVMCLRQGLRTCFGTKVPRILCRERWKSSGEKRADISKQTQSRDIGQSGQRPCSCIIKLRSQVSLYFCASDLPDPYSSPARITPSIRGRTGAIRADGAYYSSTALLSKSSLLRGPRDLHQQRGIYSILY